MNNIEIVINDEILDLDDVMSDNETLDSNACGEILEKVKYELENIRIEEGISNPELDRIEIYFKPKTIK